MSVCILDTFCGKRDFLGNYLEYADKMFNQHTRHYGAYLSIKQKWRKKWLKIKVAF